MGLSYMGLNIFEEIGKMSLELLGLLICCMHLLRKYKEGVSSPRIGNGHNGLKIYPPKNGIFK